MAVNVTDGEYAYLRAPKSADNHPCHVYTAIPAMFGSYRRHEPREIETGRFLQDTDFPMFKIPQTSKGEPYAPKRRCGR